MLSTLKQMTQSSMHCGHNYRQMVMKLFDSKFSSDRFLLCSVCTNMALQLETLWCRSFSTDMF